MACGGEPDAEIRLFTNLTEDAGKNGFRSYFRERVKNWSEIIFWTDRAAIIEEPQSAPSAFSRPSL